MAKKPLRNTRCASPKKIYQLFNPHLTTPNVFDRATGDFLGVIELTEPIQQANGVAMHYFVNTSNQALWQAWFDQKPVTLVSNT